MYVCACACACACVGSSSVGWTINFMTSSNFKSAPGNFSWQCKIPRSQMGIEISLTIGPATNQQPLQLLGRKELDPVLSWLSSWQRNWSTKHIQTHPNTPSIATMSSLQRLQAQSKPQTSRSSWGSVSHRDDPHLPTAPTATLSVSVSLHAPAVEDG